jgi:hypothetical protein
MPDTQAAQGELDFGRGNSVGYMLRKQEQAAWLARIQRESGLPVGRSVRVKLRDFDHEIAGRLGLVELPLSTTGACHVRFRVGSFEFGADELEYCVRTD